MDGSSGQFESRTRLYCIIGDSGVFHTQSARMFMQVFQRAGIQGVYAPVMVAADDLAAAVNSVRVLNLAGVNVTAPYKQQVTAYLDELSEGANIIGAVNTIVRVGDKLKGYNTNAIGFMEAIKARGIDPDGQRAIVFGAGGAARAVVFILNWLRGNSISIVARRSRSAEAIVKDIGGRVLSPTVLAKYPVRADMIVNATSVSNGNESSDMDALLKSIDVTGCRWVIDLNYGRRHNFWRTLAQRLGAEFMDGLDMVAHQARRTLFLWTGKDVEPEEFLTALHANDTRLNRTE